MTVDAALFVTNVTQDGGQPNLMGLFAGFRAIAFPHPAQFGFFIQIDFDQDEPAQPHAVHLEFRDKEGKVLTATEPVERKPEVNPFGYSVKMILAFRMATEIPEAGVYYGCVIVDGELAATSSLTVIQA